MTSIIAALDANTMLGIVCVILFMGIFIAAIWAGLQQLYIRHLHAQQIELVRETTHALSQVTATIPNITRTIEATSDLVPQVKAEIINCLNQMEMRLTNAIDRMEEKTTVNNNFSPIDRINAQDVKVGDNRDVG